jgi:outer membrane protein assembly factor BamB
MSLSLRRFAGRCGKLFSAFVGVNVACAHASRAVPTEIAVSVRSYLESPTRSPSVDESLAELPREVWRTQVGRGVLGLPAITSRVTLVTTTDRWIYALDTRTGAAYWRRRGDGSFTTGPLAHDGRVFVASEGTGGRVSALRLSDGDRIWQTTVGNVAAPLTLSANTLHGVADDGNAFALEASSGRVLWRRNVGPTRSGPMVIGHHVAIATLRDSLFVLDARTGHLAAAVPSPSTAGPLAAVGDSIIIVASPERSLAAFHVRDARRLWIATTPRAVVAAPVVVGDTIFAIEDDCSLLRYLVRTGSLSRRDEIPDCVAAAAPLVLRDGVLVATVMGDIVFLSRNGGRTLWRIPISGAMRHPPVVRDRQLIGATERGAIFGYR